GWPAPGLGPEPWGISTDSSAFTELSAKSVLTTPRAPRAVRRALSAARCPPRAVRRAPRAPALSPDAHAVFGFDVELILRLHVDRRVRVTDVRQRPVPPKLRRPVLTRHHQLA